jgi:transcriptional regulator with XRE-family HTH domain
MLGAKLRVLRKKQRYTLAEVGQKTGLSVSFLSDVERGRTGPSLETLHKLADCYDTPVQHLLEDLDAAETRPGTNYPPGFAEFLNSVPADEALISLTLKVEKLAERRATTKEDWLTYYYALKAIISH